MTHLRDLAQLKGVSVFLTSRKEHNIEVIFQGLPSIPLTDFKVKQTTDMKAYIDDQLHSRPSLSMLPPRLREEIRSSLVEKADADEQIRFVTEAEASVHFMMLHSDLEDNLRVSA